MRINRRSCRRVHAPGLVVSSRRKPIRSIGANPKWRVSPRTAFDFRRDVCIIGAAWRTVKRFYIWLHFPWRNPKHTQAHAHARRKVRAAPRRLQQPYLDAGHPWRPRGEGEGQKIFLDFYLMAAFYFVGSFIY